MVDEVPEPSVTELALLNTIPRSETGEPTVTLAGPDAPSKTASLVGPLGTPLVQLLMSEKLPPVAVNLVVGASWVTRRLSRITNWSLSLTATFPAIVST